MENNNVQQPVNKPVQKAFEDTIMAMDINQMQTQLDKIIADKKDMISKHKKAVAEYDSKAKFVRDCMKLKNKRNIFSDKQLAEKQKRAAKKK